MGDAPSSHKGGYPGRCPGRHGSATASSLGGRRHTHVPNPTLIPLHSHSCVQACVRWDVTLLPMSRAHFPTASPFCATPPSSSVVSLSRRCGRVSACARQKLCLSTRRRRLSIRDRMSPSTPSSTRATTLEESEIRQLIVVSDQLAQSTIPSGLQVSPPPAP